MLGGKIDEIKKADLDLFILCIILILSLSFMNNLVSVVWASSGDDSNEKEIGVWWVNDYPGTENDLDICDDDAEGFYNVLVSKGFTGVWKKGDSEAWESHFEKQSVYGFDYYYVDAIDFVYFSGHGNDAPAFEFGADRDNDGTYAYQLHYSEAE